MKKNRLGSSDLYVSEIGFGSMSLPNSEKEALYLVDKAIDEGINFIDTADLYDFGRIEKVLGKALKGKRDHVILATKAGNHWEAGKKDWYWDPSKTYIKEAVKNSLVRLQTDYIDLFQLHGGTIEDPIDETIEAFEELKDEGVIRYYGISSIRPNVIREYIEKSSMTSVLMQYSILDRRPEEEIFSLLKENNISVIARGPVGKGILSENGLEKVPEKGYLDYSSKELQLLVSRLKEKTNSGRLLSQTAIRYCLAGPTVATTIPGASQEKQLLENINTINTPELSHDEIDIIKHLSKENKYAQHR